MLRNTASAGEGASANVFFHDSVPADALTDAAKKAIEQASKRVGRPGEVTVGRVHRLAKSVSVRGDPDIIAELSNLDGVKSILPSQVEDIYPRPVKSKRIK
jgi:hypothetical protein